MNKAPSKICARDILLTGLVSGLVYYIVNLVLYFPSEQLRLMGGGFLKLNLFVYSFCVWFVGLTLLSAVLYVLTSPLAGDTGRRGRFILRRFIVYFIVALVIVVGHAVWMGYSRMPLLLPNYMKIRELRQPVMIAVGLAALSALILSLASALAPRRSRATAGSLVAFFVACLVYVVVMNLPVDYARLGGEKDVAAARPPRVVIFGVDAGSWNVILPFIERGDLPAFKRMMDEGTYGYLDTYGRQFTPPSWTTIATGKKEAGHGVHTFSNVSSDWQAAPIWSIMSSAGRRAGVVNWVCTWPPFEVNGGFISSMLTPRKGNAYFSEDYAAYLEPAEAILSLWEYEVPLENRVMVEHAGLEMSQLRRIEDEIMSRIAPDFLAYFYYAPDMLQHFLWKDMQPELFTEDDWAGTVPEEEFGDGIRECWLLADGFLGDLMNRYGDNACYLVLSDHGARPVTSRMVSFDMNVLLEEMGYLIRRSGEVHCEGSTCYLFRDGSRPFLFDIEINRGEYMEGDSIDEGRYREVRSRIVKDLKSVRIKGSGRHLFAGFEFPDDPGNEAKPDISVLAAKTIMEMPDREDLVVAGEREVPVASLLSFHPWSGRHRARGIMLAKGPAIKHRYSGAWTIDDAYTRIFRYTHGIFMIVDNFSGALRRLHLVDEMTTLDVAPTVLYISGLPVAEDMDGRVLAEIIKGEFADVTPLKTVPTYRIGDILHL